MLHEREDHQLQLIIKFMKRLYELAKEEQLFTFYATKGKERAFCSMIYTSKCVLNTLFTMLIAFSSPLNSQ